MWLGSLFRVFWGWNRGVGQNEYLSGGSRGKKNTSNLILVTGKIQFPVVLGLRYLLPGCCHWASLSAPGVVAFHAMWSIFKSTVENFSCSESLSYFESVTSLTLTLESMFKGLIWLSQAYPDNLSFLKSSVPYNIIYVKSIIFTVLGIIQRIYTREMGNLGGHLRILPTIALLLKL